MNKNKCAICNTRKGRRRCKKHGDKEICPTCCAETRDKDCTGCRHYENAVQYESSKISKPKKRDFIIEINEEVEKAVDDALVRAEQGDIAGAERMLEDMQADYPSNYMVIYGIGVIHALRGDHDKAIDCFDRATRIFPYFIEAHFNKAVAYQKKLDIKNAINSYNEVIELGEPKDDAVRHARKFVESMEANIWNENHISMKQYFEAQDEFEAGFSLMEDRKWEKAIIKFNRAIKLNPDHPQSYGNMGLCYAQMGRKQDALNAFNKALQIDPEYEPAILNRTFTERLEDGEPLSYDKFKSVDYYRDYPRGKKSFIQETVDAIQKEARFKNDKEEPS
jgi:tetratricopeptide (TPR) repeat protein